MRVGLTSRTGGFCVTETLQVVQNVSGTQITTSFLEGLLSGDSSTTDALSQAVSSGQLCTGCVSEWVTCQILAG